MKTSYYEREGNIYISYYVDGVRKRKSTKLKNTPENIKKVVNIIIPSLDKKIASGEIYKKKVKTFEAYGEIWKKLKEKDANYVQMTRYYNRIEKHFKGRDIDKITRLDIKEYLLNLEIKSNKPYKTVINAVFELAVDDNVINANPSLSIRMGKNRKKQIEYFTKDEVNKILSVIPDDNPLRVFLLIAFNTGMRSGEVLGLQLGDFETNHISIKRTRSQGVIGNCKTENSIRRVPCPAFLLDEVKKIQKDNIFIFGDIDDSSKLTYAWYKFLGIAKVKRIRLYCTRHTFATLMLQEKVLSINELAGVLGHTSVKTTLDKYASVIKPDSLSFENGFSLFGLSDNWHDIDTPENKEVRNSL